jgi:hypothetical protein
VLHDRQPGRVELPGWSRGLATQDPVGLLDENDGEPEPDAGVSRGDEITGVDAAARAVAEDEGGPSMCDRMQVCPGEPV